MKSLCPLKFTGIEIRTDMALPIVFKTKSSEFAYGLKYLKNHKRQLVKEIYKCIYFRNTRGGTYQYK